MPEDSKPEATSASSTPGKPAAAEPAAKAAAAKAAAKPAAKGTAKPAGAKAADVGRRAFLTTLGFGWAAFAAAMGACTAAMGRFAFPNVLYEPPTRFKVGIPDDFVIDEVNENFKQEFAVWIVRDAQGFYALSTVCTHLGCTPNWLSAERKFKCPCHGSGFYIIGVNFEGPAPLPLERYQIGRGDDGQIFVDKSRKFQQEKGQWEDPDSFLRLA